MAETDRDWNWREVSDDTWRSGSGWESWWWSSHVTIDNASRRLSRTPIFGGYHVFMDSFSFAWMPNEFVLCPFPPNVVSEGIAEPVASTVWRDAHAQKAEWEAQKLKDLKAKNYLFQAIDHSILETILNKDTSKQIWDSMKKKYQGTARVKRVKLQSLRAEFENLRMKSGELVSEYFSRTMAITNKMRIHGEKLEDVAIVEKILRSMTVKFNFVIYLIEESKDVDTLSIYDLQSSLLVHDQKLSKQDQEEQMLQAETKSVRYGHYHSKCRTNLNKDRGECSEKSNFAEKGEEISLLIVSHIQEETNENLWYLDIGCNNHMCGVKSTFSDLDESFRHTVKFGDNSTVSIMGKGRVSIQTKRNSTLSILDILYVPDLKSNLLSVGQLQEKGYEISIKDGVCQIQDDNLGLIAQIRMTTNRMFPLYLHKTTHSSFSASVKDEAWFDDAVKEVKWQKVMDEEIEAIERNNTWKLTDLPKRQKTINVKWVYKTKLKKNGEVDKYKAHLVAKGYK
nr:uncharacterized protein LOC125422966 [Ziziphus jujuba var. spinosa]